MLLTALPPAPPTPTTVIRGFSSDCVFGHDEVDCHLHPPLSAYCRWLRRSKPAAFVPGFIGVLGIAFAPLRNSPGTSARGGPIRPFGASGMRATRPRLRRLRPRWRIGEQAGAGREGRAAGRLRRGRRCGAAGRCAPACRGRRPASSRTPASWLAPPVSTTRRPAILSKPLASSRARTSSKVSSRRGWMMPTRIDCGIVVGLRAILLADLRHVDHARARRRARRRRCRRASSCARHGPAASTGRGRCRW